MVCKKGPLFVKWYFPEIKNKINYLTVEKIEPYRLYFFCNEILFVAKENLSVVLRYVRRHIACHFGIRKINMLSVTATLNDIILRHNPCHYGIQTTQPMSL